MPDRKWVAWTDERIAFERHALAVFERVLDMPVKEHSLVIDRECGSNDTLRAAVLALLEHQGPPETASAIFAQTATDFVAPIMVELANAPKEAGADAADIAAALLPRYVLHGELGHGGHATVYRAYDCSINRSVAIKVMQRERSSEESSRRFTQEIAIVARLQHPFIVPLLDSGTIDGCLYFVMPIVEGESLRQRLDRDGPLDVEVVISIVRDIAEALDHAHAQNVVHRDVKPHNILLRDGRAHLADFGIALALQGSSDEGDGRMTAPGTSIGTPLYMSPEQASASPVLDHRTDVYSLACVCYQMLTGVVPYVGSSLVVIQAQHMYEPIPDARLLRPALSHGLSRVLMRGMAKVPAERFTATGEFVSELKRAIHAPDVAGARSLVLWRNSPLAYVLRAAVVVLVSLSIMRFLAPSLFLRDRQPSSAEHR